jgi:hypothetical protein
MSGNAAEPGMLPHKSDQRTLYSVPPLKPHVVCFKSPAKHVRNNLIVLRAIGLLPYIHPAIKSIAFVMNLCLQSTALLIKQQIIIQGHKWSLNAVTYSLFWPE